MRRSERQPLSLWRFYLVVALLCCLLVVLVWRVLSLQIFDTERGYAFLQDQGANRSVRTAEIPAYRGVITDRRGEPLADRRGRARGDPDHLDALLRIP